jgi:hypothetical protein
MKVYQGCQKRCGCRPSFPLGEIEKTNIKLVVSSPWCGFHGNIQLESLMPLGDHSIIFLKGTWEDIAISSCIKNSSSVKSARAEIKDHQEPYLKCGRLKISVKKMFS